MIKNIVRSACCGLVLVMCLTVNVSAGHIPHGSRIELGAGFRLHPDHVITSRTSWNGVDLRTSSGAVGLVALSHWANENVAYAITYTVHDVEVDSWTDYYGDHMNETSVVHSLMLGFRLYPSPSRGHSAVRPYFSAGVGPFMGTTTYSEKDACDCETYDEVSNITVLGARLGGGLDFQLGRRFMLGFAGGYNFVDDFPEPIGGRYNYSGSEFGVSFSYLFGRRVY